MDFQIHFSYRNRLCHCLAVVDYREEPYYIFTTQYDEQIISTYSDDVTIKTDFNRVLPMDDDYLKGIVELRQAIFNAFVMTPEYSELKERLQLSSLERR
jgi:hypothetical protein